MNLLSILGRLPASDSPAGELDKTDWLKMIRMGIILVGSYCLTAILEALIRSVSNGEFGIPPTLVTPLTGVLSLLLEGLRRKAVSAPTE